MVHLSLRPGDLVRLKTNDNIKGMAQVYEIKDIEHLRRVMNNPEKIVSVSTKPLSGYSIPNIKAVFGHKPAKEIGLYIGTVNVEDYGRIFLYYVILLERAVYMVKDDGVELEFGKRETKFVE